MPPSLIDRSNPWPTQAAPQASIIDLRPRQPAAGVAAANPRNAPLELLRTLPVFCELPEHLLLMLAMRARRRRYERDDAIVVQDQVDDQLFILLAGRAHAERTGDNGRQVLLAVHQRGARIGEMALLDQLPHNATVRCVQPCDVLVCANSDVQHCLQQAPSFSLAWAQALVAGLRAANLRILSMSLDGVRERVMWRLDQWSETTAQGHRVVGSHVGRNELARMVGASREMVCRVLRSLQAAGRIELRRDRSIVLLDSHPA